MFFSKLGATFSLSCSAFCLIEENLKLRFENLAFANTIVATILDRSSYGERSRLDVLAIRHRQGLLLLRVVELVQAQLLILVNLIATVVVAITVIVVVVILRSGAYTRLVFGST